MKSAAIEVPPDAGEIYAQERGKPVPGYTHSRIQSRLIKLLPDNAGFEVLSELNLELNGWRCVPDISIFRRGTILPGNDVAWVREVPLATVEIISPSQTMEEMMAKVNRLLAEGVPSVWLVVPAVRVVSIFQKDQPPLSALQGDLTDPATGMTVNVGQLFV